MRVRCVWEVLEEITLRLSAVIDAFSNDNFFIDTKLNLLPAAEGTAIVKQHVASGKEGGSAP